MDGIATFDELIEEEKDMKRPGPGELWMLKSGRPEFCFHVFRRRPNSPFYDLLIVEEGNVVFILGTSFNPCKTAREGKSWRWCVRILFDEKVGYATYKFLNDWHYYFKKVS